ncbi:DUF1488 family protein [Paraburkholderia kururiensis]|uniref:DUF1488 family protein n=1 Tax=Paraburkholderia kururiensis TaxID=984307 RepID=UPI00147002F8|nr:DUF1488 family protein [Paraburkholderia kururiensis]
MAYDMAPGTHPFVIDGTVQFSMTIDGRVQRFRISQEALEDHFGDDNAQAPDLLDAFWRGGGGLWMLPLRKLV